MRIAFVGDICLDTDIATWEAASVPDLHAELDVDLVVGNFESAIDGPVVGKPVTGKICLSAPGDTLPKLRDMGVDLLSVANNHVADYGPKAAAHTIESLQREFGGDRIFGWAGQPGAELIPGLTVFAACSRRTNPLVLADDTRVPTFDGVGDAVREHVESGDALILYAHWGEEYVSLTDPELRSRARALIAAGFSQIVGTHSHVIGAGEDVDGGTVVYSLGNFLFRVIPRRNEKLLRRSKRGTVVVYEWNGRSVRLVEHWRSEFDERFNLRLEKAGRRLPGAPMSLLHLGLPEQIAGPVYRASLGSRWIRLGMARVLEGVERPSADKLRTAARLLFGRRT